MKEDSPPKKTVLHVAQRPAGPLLLFALVVVLTLWGDLLVKKMSFKQVAGQPIELQSGQANSVLQIPYHEPVTLMPYVLSLRLTLNTGAVFGIGKGGQSFFVGVSVLAVAFILWLFWNTAASAYAVQICYGLILAGALGNMYDRIIYQAVRDMFWLFPGVHLPFGWHWPGGNTDLYPWLFNIADAALVVGVGVMVLITHRADRQERKQAKINQASS